MADRHRTLTTLLTAAVTAVWALAAPAVSFAARPSELVQLKRSTEAGDPLAQFNYGQRLGDSDAREQLAWFLKAAEQGYAPAQDAVGAHYDRTFLAEPKKKQLVAIREAVRWTSRAAYQGWPAAQMRLARYFETGTGSLGRDPVLATMWIQIAVDNPSSSFGERMMASMHRDRINEHMSADNIAEGQRLASEFRYPDRDLLNPIETRLLVAGLNLTAIYRRNSHASATVNHQLFTPGETKDVDVDAHTVGLTCVTIQTTSARLKVNGTASEVTLELRK